MDHAPHQLKQDVRLGPAIALSHLKEDLARDVWGERGGRALMELASHLARVLPNADPLLGRPGPVCPFARGAMKGDHIRLMASMITADHGDERLTRDVRRMESVFAHLVAGIGDPQRRIFAAVILALPELTGPEGSAMIERVQRSLKPEFVSQGRMIGQFYAGCPEPGLHNAAFRPFDMPVPFLAIRAMTVHDAPFVLGDTALETHFVVRFATAGMQSLMATRARSDTAIPLVVD